MEPRSVKSAAQLRGYYSEPIRRSPWSKLTRGNHQNTREQRTTMINIAVINKNSQWKCAGKSAMPRLTLTGKPANRHQAVRLTAVVRQEARTDRTPEPRARTGGSMYSMVKRICSGVFTQAEGPAIRTREQALQGTGPPSRTNALNNL